MNQNPICKIKLPTYAYNYTICKFVFDLNPKYSYFKYGEGLGGPYC